MLLSLLGAQQVDAQTEEEISLIGEAIGARMLSSAMLERVGQTQCAYVLAQKAYSIESALKEVERLASELVVSQLYAIVSEKIPVVRARAASEVDSMISFAVSGLDARTACGLVVGQLLSMELASRFKLQRALDGEQYQLPY